MKCINEDAMADKSKDELFKQAKEAGLLTPETMEYLVDTEYDNAVLVEYMCLHRFPVLQFLDENIYLGEKQPESFPGRLINTVRAASGLMIYFYEHCIIIGVGDMAY